MRVDPRARKRALLVWFVALVMFVFPRRTWSIYGDALFRQPAFLLTAPLVLAGLSLFVPLKDGVDEDDSALSGSYLPRGSRSTIVKGLFGCVVLALLVIFVLLAANSDVTPENADFTHRLNIAGGVAVAVLVGLAIYIARDWKRSR